MIFSNQWKNEINALLSLYGHVLDTTEAAIGLSMLALKPLEYGLI